MWRLVLLLSIVAGCAATPLTLTPQRVTDRTVPDRTDKRFKRVMVLPPHGSDHGQSAELAGVERVLLQGGIKVISAGYTGRVVLDQSGTRVETAAALSDLERALIMAREGSKADALLQVLDASWTLQQRLFTDRGGGYQELRPGDQALGANAFRLTEQVFRFQARVINVDDGEIVMSIDVSQGTSRVLPEPKTIAIQQPIIGVPVQAIDTDNPERRQVVLDQVMGALLARLNQGPPAPTP